MTMGFPSYATPVKVGHVLIGRTVIAISMVNILSRVGCLCVTAVYINACEFPYRLRSAFCPSYLHVEVHSSSQPVGQSVNQTNPPVAVVMCVSDDGQSTSSAPPPFTFACSHTPRMIRTCSPHHHHRQGRKKSVGENIYVCMKKYKKKNYPQNGCLAESISF